MPGTSTSASAALRPIAPESFGFAEARHLLWRAGFGGTPEQVQTLVSWGPERSVDHLLNVEEVPNESDEGGSFDAGIMGPPSPEVRERYRRARQSQDENVLAQLRLERQRREAADRTQVREVQKWWLTRMIESPRPLEEKMTLFWHGHFATSYRTIEDSFHMYQQNRLFRAHALGSYADLMFAIIRDPAMLAYLDNNDSRKDQPNENLARELMELFSLGVGNYTEHDIKEGARALTGYTFEDDRFVLNQRNHDGGAKEILGVRDNLDGDGFVRAILAQPACAAFMSRKLYRFFAADLPEGEPEREARGALRELASTLRSSEYRLRPVLRKLFLSEHFYSAGVAGQRIKSPAELVVGAIRSLHTPARDLSVLLDAMGLMGQNILFPPSVAGWDGERSWINTSTMFVRQNILAYLLTGRTPRGYDALADEQRFDPAGIMASLRAADPAAASEPARVIDYLLRFTLGAVPEHARATLAAFLGENGAAITDDTITALLLLVAAMPEYQLT